MDGSEVDKPDAVGDLFEADVMTLERAGHEDLSAIPGNGGVLGDSSDLEVARVADGLGALRNGLGDGR